MKDPHKEFDNLELDKKLAAQQIHNCEDVAAVRQMLNKCQEGCYNTLKYLMEQAKDVESDLPYRGLLIDEFAKEGRRGTRFVCKKGRDMKQRALRGKK